MAKQRKAAKTSKTTKPIAARLKLKKPRSQAFLPEKTLNELEGDVRLERERVLAVLDMFKADLGDLWYAIRNRIVNGNEPRDPKYMDDRLMP